MKPEGAEKNTRRPDLVSIGFQNNINKTSKDITSISPLAATNVFNNSKQKI